MRYRKKPVEIEAVQWSGSNWHMLLEFAEKTGDRGGVYTKGADLYVRTLEGDLKAISGDWVIKGIKGELYPIRDDIFRETYEPVESEGEGEA